MSTNCLDKNMLIKWAICFIVPLLCLLLPVNEAFTMQMKLYIVVTAWGILMFLFQVTNNFTSSMLLMSGYVILGVAPLNIVAAAWTKQVPWIVLATFFLLNITLRTTIFDRIACQCIIRTGGSYLGICIGLLFISIISYIIMPGGWACLAIFALAYGICESLELDIGKASSGIMLAAGIGFHDVSNWIYTPADTGVLLGIAESVQPFPMDYVTYFQQNWVFIPFSFLMVVIITLILKPEKKFNGKDFFIEKQRNLGKITKEEKKLSVILILFVIFLFTNMLHGIDMFYGFLLAPLLCYLPGIDIGRDEDVKNINFSLIIFIVACMAIGEVATAVGIGEYASALIAPFLEGASLVSFTGIIFMFVAVLNFFMTPLAEMSALGVPITQICVDLGVNPLPMLYTFTHGFRCILFPYETSSYLALYAFGNIKMKYFVGIHAIRWAINLVYVLVIGVPYWQFIDLL